MQPDPFTPQYFAEMARLEAHHPWTRAMRALTLSLIARETARPLARVLDVGCGTGLFLDQWLASGRVDFGAGVDLYHAPLAWARERQRGTWAVASAAALPFPPGSFDAVHCADVLQHMTMGESARALELFAGLLAPGGILALRLRAPRIFRRQPDEDYSHSFARHRLGSELERCGLERRFLSHVNALPSVWAELRPAPKGSAVQGIQVCSGKDTSSLLDAYLALERFWLLRSGLPLPLGHTIICVARKPIGR